MEVRCEVCGSREVMGKIRGKYYCFKCGSRIIREHTERLLRELSEKGIVELE